jgi:hypothetical protein
MSTTPENRTAKISPTLAARLADLPPNEVIRVVVLLDMPGPPPAERRLTATERTQALAAARLTTERLWSELQPTLDTLNAERADTGGVAPFGGLVLDIPAENVETLAAVEQIRAILADQHLTRPQTT